MTNTCNHCRKNKKPRRYIACAACWAGLSNTVDGLMVRRKVLFGDQQTLRATLVPPRKPRTARGQERKTNR